MNPTPAGALPAGPYDVYFDERPGRWMIWTEHAGILAECDVEEDARNIAAKLTEAAAWAEERAALRLALEHVRGELQEHGDERGWFYGDCWQDCLDEIDKALARAGRAQEGRDG
jgi:hypothetical protein